jgi:pre-60S factor REI1
VSRIDLRSPLPEPIEEPKEPISASAQAGPSDPAAAPASETVDENVVSADHADVDEASLDSLVEKRLKTVPPVELLTCLFCPTSFDSLDSELAHMLQVHGFFIPDAEYLVDAEGLIKELGVRIGTWNVCIYCDLGFGGKVEADDGKKKKNRGLEAVRKHMCDKVGGRPVSALCMIFFLCRFAD